MEKSIQNQFKKKLAHVLENPHIPSAALSGYEDCYRIKLRKAGYRLGYQVIEKDVVVVVVAVGRRDKGEVYRDFALHYSPWR